MSRPIWLMLAAMAFNGMLHAENQATTNTPSEPTSEVATEAKAQAPFKSFTGKIHRNKVRMRLQPNTDSPIVMELNKGDMLVVVGETDDFYAVQPPEEIKGYIYRTLVLDNIVEGNNVNVRLEPSLDAPVIGQLNSGEKIDAKLAATNNKWLEIAPPANTHFYVSRLMVEKVGDAHLLATITKRRHEVNALLSSTEEKGQAELQKPYEEMQIEPVFAGYRSIIDDYSDFNDQVSKAKELLTSTQEEYLKKKIAYLENQNKKKSDALQNATKTKAVAVNPANKEATTGQTARKASTASQPQEKQFAIAEKPLPAKMTQWLSAEEALYNGWCQQHGACTLDQYYSAQRADAVALRGLIEPYTRPVKNKPGDYVLVNNNHLPIAYLYSTKVNLQDHVGQQATILVSPRPNNNFAFPAYYVLEIDN